MILRPYQKRAVEKTCKALDQHGDTLLVAPTGAGKCLGRGTPVMMFDGNIKPVETVVVGDLLMGPDSTPRRVVSTCAGSEMLYRVTPTKGMPYVVNESHILSLRDVRGSIKNIHVLEYLNKPIDWRANNFGWRVPGVMRDDRTPELTPISVKPIGVGEYFGFELSGTDRLFLLGDFTVTHNTILIGAVNGARGGRNLILQHRQELVEQNAVKFRRVNPNTRIGLFTADMKTWNGDTTFAMVQTLVRNMDHMPTFDRVTIDEAHHATSPSYIKILEAVRDRNPRCEIFGVTATPTRGDGVGLRKVFSNVADSITLGELISLGFLVRPRTFICALAGTKEKLAQVKRTRSGEYDMDEVASIMDVSVHNETVVSKWKEIAGDRRTIVFASTVEHAAHVCETFRAAGVNAAVVTGNTPSGERAAMMKSLATGDLQVLCNVAVLTEGTDIPPVSCILLLRPCSSKSVLVQAVGRGLRTVNPEEYPGVTKKDCIVIDFGNSLATHKTLEVRSKLDDRLKMCPACQGRVPCTEEVCSLCGHEFKGDGKEVIIKTAGSDEETEEVITNIELIEANLLDQSPFKWIDLFGSSKVMIACGFDAWCVVASADGENWHALGKLKEDKAMRRLQLGDRHVCLSAADDFLREHEDDTGAAQKQRRWMRDAATQKQVELLQRVGYNQATAMTFNKYSAAAALNFFWNRRSIEAFVR